MKSLSELSELKELIVGVLEENKAESVNCFDLVGKNSVSDCMIVATGRSKRHVQAVSDYVIVAVKKEDCEVLSVEGRRSGEWLLIDLGSIMVHILQKDIREEYQLEKLWENPSIIE